MKRVQEIIKEAQEFGSCYVGSWKEDFVIRTGNMIEKIERYARENRIITSYINENEECYLVVKGYRR